MEQYREMLSGAQLSIISAERGDLDGVARAIVPSVRVGGCDELAVALRRLADCCDGVPVRPRTLDLFAHSTARDGLLRLGDWVIDAAEPAVTAWFRALAGAELLPRLGIRALRLLACRTAATERGRATICALAEMLGIEVFGTPHLLYDAHHDKHGFRAEWGFLLLGSSELARNARATAGAASPRTLEIGALPAATPGPRAFPIDALAAVVLGPRSLEVDALPGAAVGPRTREVDALPATAVSPRSLEIDAVPATAVSPRSLEVDELPATAVGPRTLDVDALPARAIAPRTLARDASPTAASGPHTLDVHALPAMVLGPLPRWPRRLARSADVQRILGLIDRDAGAPLGAPALPMCEIALPTACPGAFHRAEVLYGGAFLQLYPDGADAPGVVFPVTDAAALLWIADELVSG